ncbi:AMP-binding enzyme [Streptomyces mirabilis]|uniref:AMP-binding enzyme n=1 Tax=Streptomyces mirabilis TaxID=68239 RepID=UPI003688EEE5
MRWACWDALLALPAVAEAAVVAAPDARLGEHAAAVLRLRPGHPAPTIDEMRAHLERAGQFTYSTKTWKLQCGWYAA